MSLNDLYNLAGAVAWFCICMVPLAYWSEWAFERELPISQGLLWLIPIIAFAVASGAGIYCFINGVPQ